MRPDFNAHVFPAKQLVVYVREQHTILTVKGELYVDLLPLLQEGIYTGDQMAQKLADKHGEILSRVALHRLASRNVIVSTEHTLDAQQAFYWGCLNISPALASTRLVACPVYVTSLLDRPFPQAWCEQMASWWLAFCSLMRTMLRWCCI